MDFTAEYDKLKTLADYRMSRLAASLKGEGKLVSAMKYSLLAGGKRVRFVLALAAAKVFGVLEDDIIPFAEAVEVVHTYSLIHDDLPALDNDDFRRGKPSCHKVYGENFAVIAGDGLLNLAYEILFSAIDTPQKLQAAKKVANYAGISGMVGGQAYDLDCANEKSEEYLMKIQSGKTCALIKAPLVAAEIVGGGTGDLMEKIGEYLGLIFQFRDDVLDVTGSSEKMGKTLGKDEKENKLTAVSVYGLSGAIEKIKEYYEKIEYLLEKINNSEFLLRFAKYLTERTV